MSGELRRARPERRSGDYARPRSGDEGRGGRRPAAPSSPARRVEWIDATAPAISAVRCRPTAVRATGDRSTGTGDRTGLRRSPAATPAIPYYDPSTVTATTTTLLRLSLRSVLRRATASASATSTIRSVLGLLLALRLRLQLRPLRRAAATVAIQPRRDRVGPLRLKVKPRARPGLRRRLLRRRGRQLRRHVPAAVDRGRRPPVEIRAEGFETGQFDVMVTPGETVTYKGELKRIQ